MENLTIGDEPLTTGILLEILNKNNQNLELNLKQVIKAEISGLEKKIESQEMDFSQLRTELAYISMRMNSGSSTESVQRSPTSNGLLEPRSSWGRTPLYNR